MTQEIRVHQTDGGSRDGAARADGSADPVERLWPWFNVVFGGLVVLSLVLVLSDGDTDLGRRLVGVPIVGVMIAAYIGFVRPFDLVSRTRHLQNGLYLAVAIAGFVTLALLHPSSWFLSLAVFFQVWMLLPIVAAAPISAGMSFFLWYRGSVEDGGTFDPSAASLTVFAATTVIATMLGLLIEAMSRQSQRRLDLLDRLGAERAARERLEREAGALAERTRLSRDLHDTLAQDLTSIVMHLETAVAAMPPDGAQRRQVDDAIRIARGGLGEVRRLVWALRPSQLREGTVAGALERMLAAWSTEHGATTTFRWDGEPVDLSPATEVTLLRIAQEELSNVARHAGATTVDVVVTVFDDAINLDVRDDGQGFPGDHAVRAGSAHGGGFGLLGMRERVAALSGTIAIESEPGHGTTVAVTIPLSASASASGSAESGKVPAKAPEDAAVNPPRLQPAVGEARTREAAGVVI